MDDETADKGDSVSEAPSDTIRNRIQVDLYCDLSEPAQQGMSLLLEGLAPLWNHYPVPHLERVLVVPLAQIPATVNTMVREVEGRQINYTSSPIHPATGVAVPCVDGEELLCFIVLAAEIFTDLTPERYRPADAVSTILEEFLHVWLYGEAWKRRGYFHLTSTDEPCEQDFFMKLNQAFDEYLVMRHKTAILGTLALVDGEDGPVTVVLGYGGDVGQLVAAGEQGIRQIVFDVTGGQRSVEQVWPEFCGHLYRGILEPLTRYAAVQDSYLEHPQAGEKPETPLYRRVTGPFWSALHRELRRAFDAPEETEDALRASMAELRNYLTRIGVTYRKTSDGGCYVHFDESFFLSVSLLHPT